MRHFDQSNSVTHTCTTQWSLLWFLVWFSHAACMALVQTCGRIVVCYPDGILFFTLTCRSLHSSNYYFSPRSTIREIHSDVWIGSPSDHFQVQKVQFSPDPPKGGEYLHMQIGGLLGEQYGGLRGCSCTSWMTKQFYSIDENLTAGSSLITIQFGLVPILTRQTPICSVPRFSWLFSDRCRWRVHECCLARNRLFTRCFQLNR